MSSGIDRFANKTNESNSSSIILNIKLDTFDGNIDDLILLLTNSILKI
jgi:hypothetical protein